VQGYIYPFFLFENIIIIIIITTTTTTTTAIRGPFEKFVDWRRCAAVMQREAVTVMPSCMVGVTK
jgi:hypothetical protein